MYEQIDIITCMMKNIKSFAAGASEGITHLDGELDDKGGGGVGLT